MFKKILIIAAAVFIAGCSEDDNDNKTDDSCTVDTCKDETTLYKCNDGHKVEQKCADNALCSDNACHSVVDPGGKCTADICKDETTLYKCIDQKQVEKKCADDEVCKGNACVKNNPQNPDACTVGICTSESTYKGCSDGNFTEEKMCNAGQVCEGGSCMDAFTIGERCTNDDGYGKCTADGKNAIVCHKGKITRYKCAEPCKDGTDGFVNCPHKPSKPTYDECDPKHFTPQCLNDNANVKVCVKRKIETWECANHSCAVDSEGAITCERPVDPNALTSGGTYGDPCDGKRYQEACIDNYYARICDFDNIVRIKPAGDCRIAASDPLKVEYTTAASCDPKDYMPFCINDGQAIGFCAYIDKDQTESVYKAAQCPNCDSPERAEECMRL